MEWRSRPVSRILCPPKRVATISLGATSPRPSGPEGPCSLPGSVERAARSGRAIASAGCSLLGLAPGGVCRAATVARRAGELLPHRFTLACAPRGHRRSVLCGTFRGSPRLGVTQHPALWSPDFPRRFRRGRPAGSSKPSMAGKTASEHGTLSPRREAEPRPGAARTGRARGARRQRPGWPGDPPPCSSLEAHARASPSRSP